MCCLFVCNTRHKPTIFSWIRFKASAFIIDVPPESSKAVTECHYFGLFNSKQHKALGDQRTNGILLRQTFETPISANMILTLMSSRQTDLLGNLQGFAGNSHLKLGCSP